MHYKTFFSSFLSLSNFSFSSFSFPSLHSSFPSFSLQSLHSFFTLYKLHIVTSFFIGVITYYLLEYKGVNETKEKNENFHTMALNHKFGELASQMFDLRKEFNKLESFLESQQVKTNQTCYDIKTLKEQIPNLRRRIEEIEDVLSDE